MSASSIQDYMPILGLQEEFFSSCITVDVLAWQRGLAMQRLDVLTSTAGDAPHCSV